MFYDFFEYVLTRSGYANIFYSYDVFLKYKSSIRYLGGFARTSKSEPFEGTHFFLVSSGKLKYKTAIVKEKEVTNHKTN